MGKLSERCADIARRCGDLSPLREPIRKRLWEGNRATLLAGQTSQGGPVAPLAKSTLKRRKGNGPPRVPNGAGSRLVTGCVVSVRASVGSLSFTKSWPEFDEQARHLNDGTRHMPGREFMGYRPADLDATRADLRAYVIEGK